MGPYSRNLGRQLGTVVGQTTLTLETGDETNMASMPSQNQMVASSQGMFDPLPYYS
jgi:predicted RNA-binding protein with EMAP domain